MPRRFKLTWQQGSAGRNGRWRKKYKGRTYYFDGGRGKTDREAYAAAVAAWEELKVRLDADAPRPHERDHQEALAEWEQVLAWSSQHGLQSWTEIADDRVRLIRKRLESPTLRPLPDDVRFREQFRSPVFPIENPTPLSEQDVDAIQTALAGRSYPPQNQMESRRVAAQVFANPFALQEAVWRDRLTSQRRRAASEEESLRGRVEEYKRHKEQQVDLGKLSAGRLYAIGLHLRDFCDWLGADRHVKEIDSSVLMKYRDRVLARVRADRAGDWTQTTAKHYLTTVKAFVRWLWRVEVIPDLPRVLDGRSDFLDIGDRIGRIAVFSTDQVRALLQAAPDRTKLFILLMLNCGMTQKDISDLRPDEVDWENGRITRKRSKTAQHENVPVVDYLLWPETFALLVNARSESAEHAVLNANGAPLCAESVDEHGKYRKTDNVKNAFERVRSKFDDIDQPLKALKKTSATLLRGSERFQSLEELFLGHAPKTMSDRHYARAPTALLDQAICWLRDELTIEAALAREPDQG